MRKNRFLIPKFKYGSQGGTVRFVSGDLVTVVNPYKELRSCALHTPGPLMLLLFLLLLPFLHSVQGAGTRFSEVGDFFLLFSTC